MSNVICIKDMLEENKLKYNYEKKIKQLQSLGYAILHFPLELFVINPFSEKENREIFYKFSQECEVEDYQETEVVDTFIVLAKMEVIRLMQGKKFNLGE